MIECLNGIHETVNYRDDFKMRIYRNKEYEDYPKHYHAEFEIIMPFRDTYKVDIGRRTYDLNVGDIIIIPPNTLHQLYAPPVGQRIIMQFDYSILGNLNEFDAEIYEICPCVTFIPFSKSKDHKKLTSLILNMTTEYFSTKLLREVSIYSMLLRFFIILGRNHADGNHKLVDIKSKKHIEHIELVNNACEYIDKHFTENIGIDEIAGMAGFSNSHFARIFKQVMNISWYEYLTNCRLSHAEKLLIKSDLSVMEVAMKSGFGSLATFNRLFKAKKRCTPTEYRSFHGGEIILFRK